MVGCRIPIQHAQVTFYNKVPLMTSVRSKNLSPLWNLLGCMSIMGNRMTERCHCRYDFGQKSSLNQIITNHLLKGRGLKFYGFLSYNFYEIQYNDEYNSNSCQIRMSANLRD